MVLFRSEFTGGYYSTRNTLSFPANCLATGSTNLLYLGDGKPVACKSSSTVVAGSFLALYNVSEGWAGLAGSPVLGSLFSTLGRSLISVGSGSVYYNGVSLGFNASSTPQITLYTGGSYGSTYQIGLAQPSAPTIAARTPDAGFTGKNSGSVSVKIARVRSATGAESIASLASNVVTTDKQSLRVTFPAASTGQDKWSIFVTQAGFGGSGPYYLLEEVTEAAVAAGTIDSVARSIQFEWADGDVLATLAPIDNYPPPASIFGAQIADCVCFIGCYGDTSSGVSTSSPGTAVAVSLPLYPESFPPDNLLFLPGPPTAVISRPTDGYAYVAGKDYLCALTYTGGTPALTLQEVWPSTGVQAQHNLCIVDGTLYAFIGGRGAVRMNGYEEPDSSFAAPVADEMATWTPASVVVGYDAKNQQVCFMHNDTILAFNKQVEKWSAPITPGYTAITSAVTVGGSMYFCFNSGANTVGAFNAGTASLSYVAQTPFTDSGTLHGKTISEVQLAANCGDTTALTVNVYRADRAISSTTADRSWTLTPPASGPQHFRSLKSNVRNARSFAVKVASNSTTGTNAPIALEVYGEQEGVV